MSTADPPGAPDPPSTAENPTVRRTVTVFAVGLFLRFVTRSSACSCHPPPVDDAMFTASARVHQQQAQQAPRDAGASN